MLYILLAWEPRFFIVTPAVYPHLDDFTGKLTFCYISRPELNLESQSQDKNITMILQKPPIKI